MKTEKAQTLEFDLTLARKCQTGEIKGGVYCGDGTVRHYLCSEIRDEGGGYYCAWFMSKVDGEYLQAFDEFGQIHNSKFRVLMEIYPEEPTLLIKPEVLRQMRKDLDAIMAEKKKRNPVPSDQPADQIACEDFEPEEITKGE